MNNTRYDGGASMGGYRVTPIFWHEGQGWWLPDLLPDILCRTRVGVWQTRRALARIGLAARVRNVR